MHSTEFSDLLSENQRFARIRPQSFDGIAHAGVLMVTCMDSRLMPLEMIGLRIGDAKIIRVPGGIVSEEVVEGIILGGALLEVNRVLIVQHTRCAMAYPKEKLVQQVWERTGMDVANLPNIGILDQEERLKADVQLLREHPLIPEEIHIGGFLYDVDTGLLTQIC